MARDFNFLPKWRNLAKSGHTGLCSQFKFENLFWDY